MNGCLCVGNIAALCSSNVFESSRLSGLNWPNWSKAATESWGRLLRWSEAARSPHPRARSAAKISKINSSNWQSHPSTSAARWRFCDVRFLFGKRTRAGGGIPACPADSGLSVSSVLLPVLTGPLEQAQKPCLILSPS